MSDCMITTIDNPFNPFTQYDDWLRFDEDMGYYTNEYLARIAEVSSKMPYELYEDQVEKAIDEICAYGVVGLYKKVTRDDYNGNNWHPLDVKKYLEDVSQLKDSQIKQDNE